MNRRERRSKLETVKQMLDGFFVCGRNIKMVVNTIIEQREELKTDRELCEIFGIKPVTSWRWRKERRISYRRIGGKIRYTLADINEFIERSKQAAVATNSVRREGSENGND